MSSQIGSMEVSQRIGRDVGYAASKAALNMITVKLAVRLRDEGIIAVVLHPGYLRTAWAARRRRWMPTTRRARSSTWSTG